MASKKKEALRLYNSYVNYWTVRELRTAVSCVEWNGLPKSIDKVYLEQLLNRTGAAIIVYDDVLKEYLVGQNASVGPLDIYGYPMDRKAIFRNGAQANYTMDTSVIIYNNSMRQADLWIYQLIANRMADYDMAINVNMNTQKTMPIIPTTQSQKLTVENLYSSVINNVPYVLVDSTAADTNIEAFKNAFIFDNKRSFTADGMIQVQREVWNWFLTFVGINNVNNQKKERLIVPEAEANDGEVYIMRRDRINSRERGAELMKMLWGLDVSVNYYGEGDMRNGGVYDNNSGNRDSSLDETGNDSGTGENDSSR